jgi:hypothetical protein
MDAGREQLRAHDIPFVVVDPTGEPLHDTPSVGATNWNGGLTATRHLIGLGHRRIGVIGGPEWILCSRARVDGYRAAMDEADVPVDPTLISHGAFHVDEGIERGRALLQAPNPPTAIVTGNDLQALGVYQAAREARLHIPEDLSVIGFDDLPIARWVSPPLTTIRQPLIEMAAAAAELVLSIALPAEADRITELVDRTLGRLAEAATDTPVVTHGDFQPKNVHLDPSRVVVIDFDRAASAPAARDLGHFVGQIETMGAALHGDLGVASSWVAAFLDEYVAGGGSPGAVQSTPGYVARTFAEVLYYRVVVRPVPDASFVPTWLDAWERHLLAEAHA